MGISSESSSAITSCAPCRPNARANSPPNALGSVAANVAGDAVAPPPTHAVFQ